MRSTPMHLLLPAAVLVLALTACGGAGDPEAGPTSSPTPAVTASPGPETTPEPEPAPEARPVGLRVGVNYGVFVAEDGGSFSDFTLYQPASEVVPLMTAAFGAEPVVSDHPGGLEYPPSRHYDWGGVTLIDPEGFTIMRTDLTLQITTASAGGVPVYTYFDLQVGDPMSAAYAHADETADYGGTLFAALGSLPIDPVSVGEPSDWGPLAIYVAAYSDGGSGTIDSYTAPTPNWGV